jgi:hypothetical protein
MQGEFDMAGMRPIIQILGVNAAGQESGNANIVAGRTIPWLQDTEGQHVWNAWAVTYRDVIVLDAQNRPVGVYNLTEHNLAVSANYDSLKAMMTRAAQ